MPGPSKELESLIKNMSPVLIETEYVFCSISDGSLLDKLSPLCMFTESEGISLIIEKESAIKNNVIFKSTFKQITLNVYSELETIGFISVISGYLAKHQISINPVSAFYHDHIFVLSDDAEKAFNLLKELSEKY